MCWDHTGSGQAEIVPYAAVCLALYGAGVPILFAAVFRRHGRAIVQDQRLWLVGLGGSVESNPASAAVRSIVSRFQVSAVQNLTLLSLYTHTQ